VGHRAVALCVILLCAGAHACLLTTSLGGLSGGAGSDGGDASPPTDAAGTDVAASATDAGTIRLVQSAASPDGLALNGALSTSATVLNVAAGDLLVAAVCFADTSAPATLSDSNGGAWQSVPAEANGSTQLQWWYLEPASAGTDTVTVRQKNSAAVEVFVVEYAGVGALDHAGGVPASSSTHNLATSSFTTSTDGELILALFGDNTGLGVITPGSGYTSIRVSNNFFSMLADNAPYDTPAGSQVATATSPKMQASWAAIYATFRRR
jgi:hypothetical protein